MEEDILIKAKDDKKSALIGLIGSKLGEGDTARETSGAANRSNFPTLLKVTS